MYSLLPEDSRENGEIPEPPCETREKKSPFAGQPFSQDVGGRAFQEAVGSCVRVRGGILGSWWGLRQQKANGTIPHDRGHQRALVMEHDIEEGTVYA